MTVTKNTPKSLITYTSHHKPEYSLFSRKLEEFLNKFRKIFSPFGKFEYHDNSVPFTGLFKCCFTVTISATETILTYAQQLTRTVL
jgi:hypothetical protein